MTETNIVALTKCFYCHKDSDILMAMDLKTDMSVLHGKVCNMKPCRTCEEFMTKGVILITVDDSKSAKGWSKPPSHLSERKRRHFIPNPYRTGGWFVVTADFISRVFDPEMAKQVIQFRWSFIEHEAAMTLGLFEATPTER